MIWNIEVNSPMKAASEIEGAADIVRIVEDDSIKKNIKFDEVSVPDPYPEVGSQITNKIEQQVGTSFPIIRINDIVFAQKNILNFSLNSVDFMPTVSATMILESTANANRSVPKDGDMLSLFLRTNTGALQYIRADFIITSCSITMQRHNGVTMTVSGRLFIPTFDSMNNSMGVIGTSKDVLKEIAKKYEIGFAFNDSDDTDDMQLWLACHQGMESFINEVIQHTWKDETSFFKTWIDFYYNICFINVNKFLLTSENKEEVDVTFATNIKDMYDKSIEDQDGENAGATIKILTNSNDFKGSPFYISSWHPVNNSTNISMSNGYSEISYNFIHNQNIMNNDDTDSFKELENLPAYDQEKTESYIILRGRAAYDEESNPEDEQKRVNYDFVNTYIKREWKGVDYMRDVDEKDKESTDKWSGNVHPNYSRAVEHNRININELNKIYIQVVCDGLCLQIMRGERVPVYLLYDSITDNLLNNAIEGDTARDANRFYSGYYIVDAISFTYSPDKSGGSPFKTKMTLCRREWPTPEAI